MTGHHVGLRAEAIDLLRDGGIPKSEAYCREHREKAREWGDDEAVALWTRLVWRHFAKPRYSGRQRPREIVVPVGGLVP